MVTTGRKYSGPVEADPPRSPARCSSAATTIARGTLRQRDQRVKISVLTSDCSSSESCEQLGVVLQARPGVPAERPPRRERVVERLRRWARWRTPAARRRSARSGGSPTARPDGADPSGSRAPACGTCASRARMLLVLCSDGHGCVQFLPRASGAFFGQGVVHDLSPPCERRPRRSPNRSRPWRTRPPTGPARPAVFEGGRAAAWRTAAGRRRPGG